MRSARWLALGYVAGATASALVVRRRRRGRITCRIAQIHVTPVRVGLCRFEDAPKREYRASLSWEVNPPERTRLIEQIVDRICVEHGETLRRLGEE